MIHVGTEGPGKLCVLASPVSWENRHRQYTPPTPPHRPVCCVAPVVFQRASLSLQASAALAQAPGQIPLRGKGAGQDSRCFSATSDYGVEGLCPPEALAGAQRPGGVLAGLPGFLTPPGTPAFCQGSPFRGLDFLSLPPPLSSSCTLLPTPIPCLPCLQLWPT